MNVTTFGGQFKFKVLRNDAKILVNCVYSFF